MKEFNKEELAKNNGENGAQAFIAYQGKVYDVTKSPRWEDGEHENMHNAGKDLTDDLEYMSPHGADVLVRFLVIGTLSKD